MRTSNPALSENTFQRYGYLPMNDTMTMQGSVVKTGLLLLVALLSAGWTWMKFFKSGGDVSSVSTWILVGAIGGMILAFITIFKPAWSAITAPLYALLEGFFLGGISAMMEQSFQGIVIQSVILTFGTLLVMLAAYQSGLIKVTEKFKLGIVAATGAIALFYLVAFVLSFFNIQIPFLYSSSGFSIAFSVFVVVIAALNLVLDFDFIEQGARQGVPKYMEWYAGFALMVTLVWLYIEILRLLSKVRSRD